MRRLRGRARRFRAARGAGARRPRRPGHRAGKVRRRRCGGRRRPSLQSAGITVVLGAVPDTTPAGTDLVVTTPGWRPDTPLLTHGARRGHPGDRRCRACLAAAARAARRPQAGMARGHGDERQDHHGEDAGRHAGRRRPPDDRRGQRRHPAHRRGDRARTLRGARGGAVELPAALERQPAPACRRRAQCRARSPRLARRHGRLRRGEGEDLRARHHRHLQRR